MGLFGKVFRPNIEVKVRKEYEVSQRLRVN